MPMAWISPYFFTMQETEEPYSSSKRQLSLSSVS